MLALLKWVKRVGIFIGFVVLTFLLVNVQDEALSPELKAVLSVQPLVPPEKNAFLFAMGMDAEPGRDPAQVGLDYLQQVRQVKLSPDWMAARKAVEQAAKGEKQVEFSGELPKCEEGMSCLRIYMDDAEKLLRLRETNQVLLDRYEQLLQLSAFEDAPYIGIHGSGYITGHHVASLYRALSVVSLKSGQRNEFFGRLAKQARFDRMRLRDSGGFISKMIALAERRRVALLVSEAVARDPGLAALHRSVLLEILLPLSDEERGLTKVIRGEAVVLRNIFEETMASSNASLWDRALYGLAFKHNSTVNMMWSLHDLWLSVSAVPTEECLAKEQEVLAEMERRASGVPSMELFYNPIGKVIAAIGTPSHWPKYFRRTIDTDGLLRLVSLQVQIAAQGVKEADIPDFLVHTDPKYHDPYTGKPMQWSKERGLHFRGHGDRLSDRDGWIAVRL